MIVQQGKFVGLALAAALAVSLASTGTPAGAQQVDGPPDPVRAFSVPHADLDLRSRAGQWRLGTRLRNAAERVCRDGGAQALRARTAVARCVEEALASASESAEHAFALQRQQQRQFAGRRLR